MRALSGRPAFAARASVADQVSVVWPVALNGFNQDEDRRRSAEAGFDHHLVKPVDVQKLWQLLRSL